jgi:AcrR family transcriptional regulator
MALQAPRLRRPQRRDQILAAATRAFARFGFTATSLDDIATEAHVSRVILYRHFESKTNLYRAVLDRAYAHLYAAVGVGEYTSDTIPALISAAAEDPDGFRLLFHHAAREPEFRAEMDHFRANAVQLARRQIVRMVSQPAWAQWASNLAPTLTVDAVIAWLDAGQPDPASAPARIGQVVGCMIAAAQGRT